MRTIFQGISHAIQKNIPFLKRRTEIANSAPNQYEILNETIEITTSDNVMPEQKAVSQPSSSASALEVTKGLASIVFSKENIPRITAAGALTGFSMAMNFLAPYLFGQAISLLSSEDETTTIGGIQMSRPALIVATLLAYTLAQGLPNARDQVMVPVTSHNTKKVINRIIGHLLKKSLASHRNTPFSDQAFLVHKGFAAGSIATPLLTQVVPTITEIGIACGMLSHRYGIEVGLALLVILASHTGYSSLTANSIIQAREANLKAGSDAYQDFFSALSKYKIMHDFGKFDESMAKTDLALNSMVNAEITAAVKPLQIELGHIAIARLSMLVALLYVGTGVAAGKYNVQDFIVLTGYLHPLCDLLAKYGQTLNHVLASYPDLKFVFHELAKPDEVVDLHPNTPLVIDPNVPPSIEFENVTFRYPTMPGETVKPPIFQNLSFEVLSGQKVAFVGESGEGKTTLFNLLFRYYEPDEGVIKINGQDISKVSLKSLRKNITLFGQTPNLFNGTARENIRYGAQNSDQVTDVIIQELATTANLQDFLNSLDKGLDKDVGENGAKLSGGQQQKIAISRGLMKESSIYLLDEVTASLDSQSATNVLEGINKLSAHKVTRLTITHSLEQVESLDKIFVIKNGTIIAEGTHNELLKDCELYARLCKNQESQEKSADGDLTLDDKRAVRRSRTW